MDNLTEKSWEKICKDKGIAFNPLWKTRGEYANVPAYLREYISLKAKREFFDDLIKTGIWDINQSQAQEVIFPADTFPKLQERHNLTVPFNLRKEIENIYLSCNEERVFEIQKKLGDLLRKIGKGDE